MCTVYFGRSTAAWVYWYDKFYPSALEKLILLQNTHGLLVIGIRCSVFPETIKINALLISVPDINYNESWQI